MPFSCTKIVLSGLVKATKISLPSSQDCCWKYDVDHPSGPFPSSEGFQQIIEVTSPWESHLSQLMGQSWAPLLLVLPPETHSELQGILYSPLSLKVMMTWRRARSHPFVPKLNGSSWSPAHTSPVLMSNVPCHFMDLHEQNVLVKLTNGLDWFSWEKWCFFHLCQLISIP